VSLSDQDKVFKKNYQQMNLNFDNNERFPITRDLAIVNECVSRNCYNSGTTYIGIFS